MPTPPEVIVIGTSSPAVKTPIETIVIGSDAPVTPVAEQGAGRTEADARRLSDILNQFRAKWSTRHRTSVQADLHCEAVGESLQEEVGARAVVEPQVTLTAKTAPERRKNARKQPAAAKAKKPRSKNEALGEIECVVDERLDLDCLALPSNLRVTRQRLPFDPFHGVLWKDKDGQVSPWITCVYHCDRRLVDSPEDVLEQLAASTGSYPKKVLLLTGWRDFASDYDKQMQRGFQRALKENARFSGSMFVNLETWRRGLFLACLSRGVLLIEADLNGSFGRAVERWIAEAGKAVAWTPHRLASREGLLGFCTAQKRKRVGKTPQDLLRRMLECVPRVSQSIIDAIVRKYPDVRGLVEGLRSGGPHTLANLQVNSQRTLGPVLSEKLHFLFTATELRSKKIN